MERAVARRPRLPLLPRTGAPTRESPRPGLFRDDITDSPPRLQGSPLGCPTAAKRAVGAPIPGPHQHAKAATGGDPRHQDHGGRRGPELASQPFLFQGLNQCPTLGTAPVHGALLAPGQPTTPLGVPGPAWQHVGLSKSMWDVCLDRPVLVMARPVSPQPALALHIPGSVPGPGSVWGLPPRPVASLLAPFPAIAHTREPPPSTENQLQDSGCDLAGLAEDPDGRSRSAPSPEDHRLGPHLLPDGHLTTPHASFLVWAEAIVRTSSRDRTADVGPQHAHLRNSSTAMGTPCAHSHGTGWTQRPWTALGGGAGPPRPPLR